MHVCFCSTEIWGNRAFCAEGDNWQVSNSLIGGLWEGVPSLLAMDEWGWPL
jgi:hypothetical protein